MVAEAAKSQAEGDVSEHAAKTLVHVMRAQALECYLTKAINTGLGKGTVARVAAQIADIYDDALKALAHITIEQKSNHPWRHWGAMLQMKAMLKRATAQYYMAGACKERTQAGEEVARLHASRDLCEQLQKVATEL